MICRGANVEDIPFLVETFCRSIRVACTHVEGLSKERTARLLTNLLANGWTATVCEADGMIYGWAVHGDKNRLAWVYVRDMARGKGVARYLLKHAGIDTAKAITTPFVPNRERIRWRLNHRPFECIV